MFSQKAWIACGLVLSGIVLVSGCADRGSNSAKTSSESTTNVVPAAATATARTSATNDEEHGHKAGVHGGIMVSLGRDSYHAEAVFEKGGLLRLYTLGKDE